MKIHTRKCKGCDKTIEYFYRKNVYYCSKDCKDRKNERNLPESKYKCYKKGAIKRGLEFNLTKIEFNEYWGMPCFYCGSDILTIGIDRIDSNLGYFKENIVPCCTTCNMSKHFLSSIEYIKHCKKVAEFDNKN